MKVSFAAAHLLCCCMQLLAHTCNFGSWAAHNLLAPADPVTLDWRELFQQTSTDKPTIGSPFRWTSKVSGTLMKKVEHMQLKCRRDFSEELVETKPELKESEHIRFFRQTQTQIQWDVSLSVCSAGCTKSQLFANPFPQLNEVESSLIFCLVFMILSCKFVLSMKRLLSKCLVMETRGEEQWTLRQLIFPRLYHVSVVILVLIDTALLLLCALKFTGWWRPV